MRLSPRAKCCTNLRCITILQLSRPDRTGITPTSHVFHGRVEAVDVDEITMDVRRHGFVEVIPPTTVGDEPTMSNEAEPGGEEE